MVAQIKPNFESEIISMDRQVQKHRKLIATTYANNVDSDYTEKIQALNKSFNYSHNRDHYWSEPEQSMLYGTRLYEAASPTQKLALNHIHWFTNYNYISDSETETANFNQITASVFQSLGGYETLAEELALETDQEYYHINAFRRMGLMTANALIGKSGLNALLRWNSYKLTLGHDPVATSQYYVLRTLAKKMFGRTRLHYSAYLQGLESKSQFILKAPTTGMLGRSLEFSLPLQSFFSFNWGSGSPFMACQFFALRMIANLYLKNMEHSIVKYGRTLEKAGAFVPTPTLVSRYHFLDEAFHTTMSQLLAKDLYKEFAQPTAYEKFVANMAIYMLQRGTLGGLSGVLPHRYFADDYTILELLYQLLQGPVFGLSSQDALHAMEQCLCREHEGFHVAYQNRQRLLFEMRRFFQNFDYLWPVNREMRVMASRGSIAEAIKNNTRTFEQFTRLAAG
jgi:hypothetical protein